MLSFVLDELTPGIAQIPSIPFFTPEEENYWVEQYEKSGFDHSTPTYILYYGL